MREGKIASTFRICRLSTAAITEQAGLFSKPLNDPNQPVRWDREFTTVAD
jgi:hypothetical protein